MTTRVRLGLALVLVAFVAALEFWGGVRSGSLALVTDAVHVCMDMFALAIALFASIGAARPANASRTFGYGRVEMLGALANGALLIGAVIFVVYEAIGRFAHPSLPQGGLMSGIAFVGLVFNLGAGLLLMRDGHHDLNVRAALFHIAGDAVGGVAVIAGGFVIVATGAAWIDPLLSLFVAAVIVLGVVGILRDATDVLLESVPRGMETGAISACVCAIDGVVAVHDLHIWTIGSGEHALSAHVQIDDRAVSEADALLREIDAQLRSAYGITHATLQLECATCEPDSSAICTRLGNL
ncbi:MAG: cation diffusion facilitator family transporter [Candidatus Eremiobacteraeota bacterium]|nr:cation diffusion facilitator family transporter [Candidatus Eremiobacteraeota bacterium]